MVARSTRAWIETPEKHFTTTTVGVARSTRAWIETTTTATILAPTGLVARSTRAWIETQRLKSSRWLESCRTLYACVD